MNHHQTQFIKTIKHLSSRYHLWQVFSDFCEMSALAMSNTMAFQQDREDRYLSIISRYNEKERLEFPKMYSLTVEGLESMDCDFLGELFMHLELSSHWQGQFFTPFHLSLMMAQTNTQDMEESLITREFVTVSEPACGSGGMIIALARALIDKGVNYQQVIHVSAVDVSSTAAYMAYIQLSLLHVPAVVYVGNTLSMEMREAFKTPAHIMGFWDYRLQAGNKIKESVIEAVGQPITVVTEPTGQAAFNF